MKPNRNSSDGTAADSEQMLMFERPAKLLPSPMLGAVALDWKLGKVVNVMWFGNLKPMKIIGHDEPSNQVKVQHLDAMGSFYETAERLLELSNCP